MKKIIAIIVILILIGGFFILSEEEPLSYQTTNAKISTLNLSVSALGDAYANEIVTIGAQASGEILTLGPKVGDFVKKGELIAKLDQEKQQNNLNIELAKQNSLKALKKSKELSLEIASLELSNQEKLYKKSATSYDNLMKAKNDFYDSKSQLEQINTQILQNKISVENYKKELEYTKITAPISGHIISLNASAGQTINASLNSPVIAKIADTSKMEIKLLISQNDVNKLKKGMDVEFYTLANEQKKYKAKLESIDIADTVENSGLNKGAIYYFARFYVPNENGELKIGMSIVATIHIQSLKDVLLLPTNCIQKDDGGYFVNVLKDEQAVKTYVKIGQSDNFSTQILQGIGEAEKVITNLSKNQ